MGQLTVRLVAADREVWAGDASLVVAKTVEGEIGILPGHEPVLALLADGVVRIDGVDGETLTAAVHGGFFSVNSDQVAILAEAAELSHEIDVQRAQRAIDRAEANGADDPDEIAAIHRAQTRLQAAVGHQTGLHGR